MRGLAEIIDDKTICVYDKSQFDIDAILHSGQVFRYFKGPDGYTLVVGRNVAKIQAQDDKVTIECDNARYFWDYFDLGTDYNEIKRELAKYKTIKRILETNASGIRILRGEFIEIVVSFIISANNNIKRFTKTLNLICEKYGAGLGGGLFAFPTLEQLSKATAAEFHALGCGYRSEHLVKAIEQLLGPEFDMAELCSLEPNALAKRIESLRGVGPKVRSCVLLFCGDFHRLDLAPQDTWIRKALVGLPEQEREALLSHRFAGVAQQYIFYYLQYLRRGDFFTGSPK